MKETQKFKNSMIAILIMYIIFISLLIWIGFQMNMRFMYILALILAAFIIILFVCGIMQDKNKNGETVAKFMSASAIGPITENSPITITIRPEELYIYHNNNENICASLAMNKITGVSTSFKNDVINKNTSFNQRAFWGGLFFGLFGALLGGLSAMNGKSKVVRTNLISIGYTSDEGKQEFILLKILPFQAWAPFMDELNENISTFKKAYEL